jgi:hypothetical protein
MSKPRLSAKLALIKRVTLRLSIHILGWHEIGRITAARWRPVIEALQDDSRHQPNKNFQ